MTTKLQRKVPQRRSIDSAKRIFCLEIDVETLELPPLPEHIQALLTPKYRLVINKIEINNFKSFAGRIQLDQFDEVCSSALLFR